MFIIIFPIKFNLEYLFFSDTERVCGRYIVYSMYRNIVGRAASIMDLIGLLWSSKEIGHIISS